MPYIMIFSWNIVVKHSSVTLVHGDSRDAERQDGKHGELDPHAAAHTVCPAMQRVPLCRLLSTHWPRVGRTGIGNVSSTDLYQEQRLGTPIYEIMSHEHSIFTLRDLAYFIEPYLKTN